MEREKLKKTILKPVSAASVPKKVDGTTNSSVLKKKSSTVVKKPAVVLPSPVTNASVSAAPAELTPSTPPVASLTVKSMSPGTAPAVPLPLPNAQAEMSGAMLYKPNRNDTKQVGHVPLPRLLKMLRYAARHGDYAHVYSVGLVMVDAGCVQCLRRELVEFMLGSGFLLWYPMQALSVLQVLPADLPSYFANVCFDASTSDFFNFIDLCTRRACDVNYNFSRDLSITLNDAALGEAISALYASHECAPELQARGITFAYALVAGINSSESSAFDMSWLDVALRNAFFLSKFGLPKLFCIFELLCTHYKFCEPYLELLPKVRALLDKLDEGKPSDFHWNRGCRLIVVFLVFFFFFKCVYAPRALPAHAVIPTVKVPFSVKYDAFIAPSQHDYVFMRFGNLKCNMFRNYVFAMVAGVPRTPLRTVAFPPFERNFAKSVNALWRSKYTNVTLATHEHFLISRLNRNLPIKAAETQKTIVIGPVFQAEMESIGSKIAFWMGKFDALKIGGKVAECVRLYFAENFAATHGGMLYIHVPLSAEIKRVEEGAWDTMFVKMFGVLCATYISEIGLSRDMFYYVDGKIFCAAMWMPVVVSAQRFTVEQQLTFLSIDSAFYEKQKKFI